MALPVVPSPRFPKDLILSIIAFCAQTQVVWKTGQKPHGGQTPGQEAAWIEMTVGDLVEIGEHELRTGYDAATDSVEQIVIGQRTGDVVCEAMSLDPSLEAYDLLERVRFRLHNKPARDLFVGAVSLRDCPRITPFEAVAAGRVILAARMTVRWNYFLAGDPEEPGGSEYVKTVNGGAGPAFTPLP